MGLLNRIFGGGKGNYVNMTQDELWERITSDSYNNSRIYFSDGTIIRGNANTLSSSYRAICLLATALAVTPLEIIDRHGRLLVTDPDAPNYDPAAHLARLWQRCLSGGKPDGRYDRFRFIEQVGIDLINRGNAFLLPSIDPMKGGKLEILRPVLSGYGSSEGIGFVRSLPLDSEWEMYEITGARRRVDPNRLIHISLPTIGIEVSQDKLPLGLPVALVVKDAVAGGKASDNYIVETISSSNRLGYKMELARPLESDEEVDRYHQYSERARGTKRLMLADGGAKISEVKAPAEMIKAVVEARNEQIADVARAYGIPAPLIGLTSSAWAAGVEQLARVFLRFSMRPFWFGRVAAALSANLLPPGYTFRFSDTDFLRGDWQAWSALAGAATQSGALSEEELRDAAGFQREFPEGETRLTTPYAGKGNNGGFDSKNSNG